MIPISSDQIEKWTPESLRNAPTPPVFLFQPVTHRHKKAFETALVEEGITFNQTDAVRDAIFKALESLWTPELYERESARLRQAFDNMDAGIIISDEDQEHVNDLIQRVQAVSPTVGRMVAQNMRFHSETPKVAVSLVLVGWIGLDTKYQRAGMTIPMETMDALAAEILLLEHRLMGDGIKFDGQSEPGTAFMELSLKAFQSLDLTGAERKNSVAPSPSGATLNGSTPVGLETPDPASSTTKRSRSPKSKQST